MGYICIKLKCLTKQFKNFVINTEAAYDQSKQKKDLIRYKTSEVKPTLPKFNINHAKSMYLTYQSFERIWQWCHNNISIYSGICLKHE